MVEWLVQPSNWCPRLIAFSEPVCKLQNKGKALQRRVGNLHQRLKEGRGVVVKERGGELISNGETSAHYCMNNLGTLHLLLGREQALAISACTMHISAFAQCTLHPTHPYVHIATYSSLSAHCTPYPYVAPCTLHTVQWTPLYSHCSYRYNL